MSSIASSLGLNLSEAPGLNLNTLYLLGIPFLPLSLYFLASGFNKRKQLPYPPGPKGLPVIGNLLQMPQKYEHEVYREWCKEYGMCFLLDMCFVSYTSGIILIFTSLISYLHHLRIVSFPPFFTRILTMCPSPGPLIHLQILNQHLIIIDSYPVAIDILEKRSGIYSSRAPIPMLRLMGGWDTAQIAFIPYGECVFLDSLVQAGTLPPCLLSSFVTFVRVLYCQHGS
jgi:hypothetical protein